MQLHPGATFKSIVLGPLPLRLTGDAGRSGIQFVNEYLFARDRLPASFGPGVFGDFYADDAWPTLVLWSLIVGICVRALWEYYRLYSENEGMQLVFAVSLAMLVLMTRNNLPDMVARGAYFIGPPILCLLFCSTSRVRRRMPGLARSSAVSPPN
jgi:hypothetical protein